MAPKTAEKERLLPINKSTLHIVTHWHCHIWDTNRDENVHTNSNPKYLWLTGVHSLKHPGQRDRKRVHWGQTPFRVKDDPEIGQLCSRLDKIMGSDSTQLWVTFRVKLTDFRVIFVDPEWTLGPNGYPFPGQFLTRVFLECRGGGGGGGVRQGQIFTPFYLWSFRSQKKRTDKCHGGYTLTK